MYFRWKDRRIVVKFAVWGAEEGTAAPLIHTLADATSARVDAGELEPPADDRAVGLARNGEAITVDEEDRRMTMTVCHPAGPAGRYGDTPVDYKCVAPEAPVRGNRAFEDVLHDVTGVIFLSAGDPEVDGPALEALRDGLSSSQEPVDPILQVLLSPRGAAPPEPDAFHDRHDLPESASVRVCKTWQADDVWEAFLALCDDVRPLIERASDTGRLPV